MFSRPFVLFACVLLCVGCLFGNLHHLQAGSQEIPQTIEVVAPKSAVRSVSQPATDISSEFYQTLIKHNLFALLGTVLTQKPVPGANLKLVGTFVNKDAVRSTALINNGTTPSVVSIGSVLSDFTVMKIQPKQVTLDHPGKRPVVLYLPEPVFLNTKRR